MACHFLCGVKMTLWDYDTRYQRVMPVAMQHMPVAMQHMPVAMQHMPVTKVTTKDNNMQMCDINRSFSWDVVRLKASTEARDMTIILLRQFATMKALTDSHQHMRNQIHV